MFRSIIVSGFVALLAINTANAESILFCRSLIGAGNHDLYTIQSDGSQLNAFYGDPGNALDPAWSSSHDQVTYRSNASSTGQSEVFMINADGSQRWQLSTANNDVREPQFSSTNTIWYVKSLGYHQADLFEVDPITFSETRLTDYQSQGNMLYNYAFGPSGLLVIGLEASVGSAGELFITSTDFSETLVPLTTGNYDEHPSFSPDGNKIAFTRMAANNGSRPGNIWVINRDGTQLTQLTFGTGAEAYFNPAWSPDGNKIVCEYSYQDYAPSDLIVMNADGTGLQNITNTPEFDEVAPIWDFVTYGPGQCSFVPGDVNGDCHMNGIDVVYMVNYLKGGPGLVWRSDCE
jgi:Tol biopolymer transport system component